MENAQQVRAALYVEVAKIVLAALIAFVALASTAGQRIDLENLAKGEQNSSSTEETNGKPYTAYTVKDIKALMDTLSTVRSIYTDIPKHDSMELMRKLLYASVGALPYLLLCSRGSPSEPRRYGSPLSFSVR